MGTTKKAQPADQLEKALLSAGVDKQSARSLTSSKSLDRIVIPVYWKDGLVVHSRNVWLQKLPELLRWFREEFPDGQVRWDPDFENDDPSIGDSAIRIYFNYQEDDQGDHWSPPPTLLEEESYNKMLSKVSFKGTRPVTVGKVLHAR